MNEKEINVYKEINNIFFSNYCKNYTYNDIIYTAKFEKYLFKAIEKELMYEGYLKVYKNASHKYKAILESGLYSVKYEVADVESKPKPLYTEVTLISKMENIHNEKESEV